jgi:hypothetical protein
MGRTTSFVLESVAESVNCYVLGGAVMGKDRFEG